MELVCLCRCHRNQDAASPPLCMPGLLFPGRPRSPLLLWICPGEGTEGTSLRPGSWACPRRGWEPWTSSPPKLPGSRDGGGLRCPPARSLLAFAGQLQAESKGPGWASPGVTTGRAQLRWGVFASALLGASWGVAFIRAHVESLFTLLGTLLTGVGWEMLIPF